MSERTTLTEYLNIKTITSRKAETELLHRVTRGLSAAAEVAVSLVVTLPDARRLR